MTSQIYIEIEACTRCHQCIKDCPSQALVATSEGTPSLISENCIDCGHCGAVCRPGAVRSRAGCFTPWAPPELPAPDLKTFLVGRRSVRRYRTDPISHDTIAEALSVGPYAPTACNSQSVAATVFTGDALHEFARQVNDYYRKLDRLMRYRFLWPLLSLTPLRRYVMNPSKRAAMHHRVESFSRDNDWIFLGAPAVVVLTCPRKEKLFGRVNCTIAAERILQYAQALGLGSCLIGFADAALRKRPSIAPAMGIDKDRIPQVVFTLGVPAVTYHRLPVRQPIPCDFRT